MALLDRDVPDKECNEYLKHYGDTFEVFKHEDGIWCIRTEKGYIAPYSIVNKELVYYGDFIDYRMNGFIKKLPDYAKITQIGDEEVCVKFKENRIKEVGKILKIKQKNRKIIGGGIP